jgi:hypothetical protein|tara:strand:- start:446 stop:856 length:411 start_codon:yes stop_codon:yes gene_type:complete
MSEIKTNKLTGVTTAKTVTVTVGASVTQTLESGLIKAYSEQDNTSVDPLNKSLNHSSVTDTNGGHKIHNFTSAFSDIVYLCLPGCCGNRGSTTGSVRGVMPDAAYTTTAADMRYAYATSNANDDSQAGMAVLGDLA